jgi:hypothetical protein
MIRREKHIEIRLRVLEQLDEILRLRQTRDGSLRTFQSDNRPIPKQDSRAQTSIQFLFPELNSCAAAILSKNSAEAASRS